MENSSVLNIRREFFDLISQILEQEGHRFFHSKKYRLCYWTDLLEEGIRVDCAACAMRSACDPSDVEVNEEDDQSHTSKPRNGVVHEVLDCFLCVKSACQGQECHDLS